MLDLQPDLELTTVQAERLLEAWLGGPLECTGIRRLHGGLVNSVLLLEFDRPPHRAVVKLHSGSGDGFVAEARALDYLRSQTACPVPRVYLQDSTAEVIPHAFLLIEHLPGRCLEGLELEPEARAEIESQLADVLGELHGHQGERWGGIDAVDASASWADVFGARLAAAREHPEVGIRLEPGVLAAVDRAIGAVPALLADAGTPTLVHGDVWDGNIIVRHDGSRWRLAGLLDPDLQYADVEYELAYLEVFDVPRDAFFAAYRRHRALRPGYERRRLVYWLYTALVHVALFGDAFFCEFSASTTAAIDRLHAP